MKHTAGFMLLATAAALVFGYMSDFRTDDRRAVAAPPLSLEGYLDEKLPDGSPDDAKIKVDNQPCYVCHGNYDGEELVKMHARKKVACIDCHGESYAHRNDEDNVTPPEKMYAPDDVDKMCSNCHKEHNAPARKVIQQWQQRFPTKTNPEQIVCTDCHGQHRLKFRTVWWDKKTRKLVIRGKQRVKMNPDYTDKRPKAKPGEPPGEELERDVKMR